MDGAINFFNMEIGVFLRYLHYFSNIECVKISNQTVKLLQLTTQSIVELTNVADVVEVAEAADVDFLFDLDEHQYELQRYIACHECNKLIRLTRLEYVAHACSHDVNRDFELTHSLSELSMNNTSSSSQMFESKMANTNVSDEQLERSSDSHRSVDEPCYNLYDISNKKFNDVVMVEKEVTAPLLQQQSCIRKSNDSLVSTDSSNSLKSNYSSYFVKMRGLPWTATKSEIQNFFAGVQIHNGLNGIHFITDDQSNVGVAFVELASKKYFEQALKYHKKKLDERYIEIQKANDQDFILLAKNHTLDNKDNILRLDGLPWNAKEADIVKFFSGLKLNDVKLISDKRTNQTLEAFVRFSSVRDYDSALKHNWRLMGIRHVKIYRSSEELMKLRLRAEKGNQYQIETSRMIDMDNFPSLPAVKNAGKFYEPEWQQVGARKSKVDKKKSADRTYMVIARGFPWKVTKQNVMEFFKGIKIVNGEDGINIVKNVAMEAHVVLASKADRKKALTLHNKLFESRAIGVTELESKTQVFSPTVVPMTSNVCQIIQIRGLPWSVDKDFIVQLFPGMKIDYETGIQIEQDENQRRTGFAFVKFERACDYEKAFKLDLRDINPYLKLFKSTQEFFDRKAAANEAFECVDRNHCKKFQQHFPVIGKKKKRS